MPKCRYCGQSAGLFSSAHIECESQHSEATDRLADLARDVAQGNLSPQALRGWMPAIVERGRLSPAQAHSCLVGGWEAAVDAFLEDGIIDPQEESFLAAYMQEFQLDQRELDARGAFSKVGKALILRDVLEGRVPSRLRLELTLPFNLLKSEKLIWLLQNVDYLEDRNIRQYVGTSRGVSVRLARGVYYKVGACQGQIVQTTQSTFIGTGFLGVTNRHLYFASTQKSLRIPYAKIVSLQPCTNGIIVHRDAASALPQMFRNDDGWFLYNLAVNAQNAE